MITPKDLADLDEAIEQVARHNEILETKMNRVRPLPYRKQEDEHNAILQALQLLKVGQVEQAKVVLEKSL